MGNVILPNGQSIETKEFPHSINLSRLIADSKSEDYTPKYRLSTIKALSNLGKYAKDSIVSLKEIERVYSLSTNESLKQLAEASTEAIKIIEDAQKLVNNVGYNYSKGYSQTGYSTGSKTESSRIDFEEIDDFDLQAGNKVYRKCCFCNKSTMATSKQKEISDTLSKKFHCLFCLKNDFHQKTNKNVMILSYRGIIAYYYYAYHVAPKSSASMYCTDIEDYIKKHVHIGSLNPAFRYDPDTFLWFIDFSKVGSEKIPITEVLKTIISQLSIFELLENINGISQRKIFDKFKEGITEFYLNRRRIVNNIFTPTLLDCGIPVSGTKMIPEEIIKDFVLSQLDSSYQNRTNKRW